MSQDNIFEIIRDSKTPLNADEIMLLLKKKGIEINKSTFYINIKKLEKDNCVSWERKTVLRYSIGKRYKFSVKRWFYATNNNETG